MDIVEIFSMEGVVRHWNRLPWAVMESPAPEGFKSLMDVAAGDMVALAVLGEQLDSMVSEGFSNVNDSMILCLFSPWQKFLLILSALAFCIFKCHLWRYFHIHSVLPPTLPLLITALVPSAPFLPSTAI